MEIKFKNGSKIQILKRCDIIRSSRGNEQIKNFLMEYETQWVIDKNDSKEGDRD